MKYIREMNRWPLEFDFAITTRTKTTDDLWPSSASSSDLGDLEDHSSDSQASTSSSSSSDGGDFSDG